MRDLGDHDLTEDDVADMLYEQWRDDQIEAEREAEYQQIVWESVHPSFLASDWEPPAVLDVCEMCGDQCPPDNLQRTPDGQAFCPQCFTDWEIFAP